MGRKEVLIVGAGPTGLLMAHLLRRAHIPFRIIEKKEEPTTLSKALAVHCRTLEIFQDIDVIEEILQKGIPIQGMDFTEGKKRLVHFDFTTLPSKFNTILIVPQSETEKVLAGSLDKKKVEINWKSELVDLVSTKDGIKASIKGPSSEITQEEFSYVVGCDGMHSLTREKANISFRGKDMKDALSFADLKVHGQIDRKNGILALAKNKDGIIIFLPLPNGKTRLIINNCSITKKEEATNAYFTKVLQDRYDESMTTSDIDWATVFYIHYKEASYFCKDRFFLVGDAAHVHSPMAGQGMNTGLQDAYNLAWKLSLVCKKKASQKLLKTYHEERHANGKKLLRITNLLTTITASRGFFLKFIRPYWIKYVMGKTKIKEMMKMRLSQLEANYRHMTLSEDKAGLFYKGPKAGERAADLKISQKRLFDYIGKNLFTLLLFLPKNGELSFSDKKKFLKYLDLQNKYVNDMRVVVVTRNKRDLEDLGFLHLLLEENEALYKAYGVTDKAQYLIRPDQYVGLRAQDLDPKKIQNYLKRVLDLI